MLRMWHWDDVGIHLQLLHTACQFYQSTTTPSSHSTSCWTSLDLDGNIDVKIIHIEGSVTAEIKPEICFDLRVSQASLSRVFFEPKVERRVEHLDMGGGKRSRCESKKESSGWEMVVAGRRRDMDHTLKHLWCVDWQAWTGHTKRELRTIP